MQFSHNSRVHATHIGDTPDVPGYDEQGTSHCRTLQDFFIRPLLSKARDVPLLANTEKQTWRIKQNEETAEWVPKERIGQKSQQES